MDGRHRALVCAGFSLALIAGCQSTKTGPSLTGNLSAPAVYKPEAGNATVARAVSHAADPKKKNEPLKPATWIALAEFRQQMAENPELSFGEAEQLRSGARQAYQEALKLDPKNATAYIGLAKSYVAIEDAAQAYAMYDKALAQTPNEPLLWFEKGMTHARFKDFDGAVEAMRKGCQLDVDNRMYKKTLGMTLARAGRMDEAFSTLRGCMKEEEVHYTLARMCRHMDRPDMAKDYASRSLKARPTYMPAHEFMREMADPNYSGMNDVQTVGYSQPAIQKQTATPKATASGVE